HCNRLINGAPFGERLETECMTIAIFRLTCSDSSKPTQVSLLSLDQADWASTHGEGGYRFCHPSSWNRKSQIERRDQGPLKGSIESGPVPKSSCRPGCSSAGRSRDSTSS